MVRIIESLAADWRRLDERIEVVSNEIEELAKQDTGCERLMSIPGLGPIISSASWPPSGRARFSRREVTSPRGLDSYPNRYQRATGPLTSARPNCARIRNRRAKLRIDFYPVRKVRLLLGVGAAALALFVSIVLEIAYSSKMARTGLGSSG
jgi:hypothetical protein